MANRSRRSGSRKAVSGRQQAGHSLSKGKGRRKPRGRKTGAPLWAKLTLTFGALLLLYRLVPRARLRYRDLAVGALAATIASEAIRIGFSYYLARVARYDLLYGALGSVFAFLLVVYLQAIVLLLGAEIAQSWSQSAYGPQEAPVPFSKQARDMVRGLFVRRP